MWPGSQRKFPLDLRRETYFGGLSVCTFKTDITSDHAKV